QDVEPGDFVGGESSHGSPRLFAAAPPVLFTVDPMLGDRLDASTTVGQEEDAHGGVRRGELGEQAAAAEDLVVEVGREDQGARGAHPLGPAGRSATRQIAVSSHWMYPRLRRLFSVSGLIGACRFTTLEWSCNQSRTLAGSTATIRPKSPSIRSPLPPGAPVRSKRSRVPDSSTWSSGPRK